MDIINSILPTLEHFKYLSYWIIFLVFILESIAFVGIFIPGAAMLVIAGFLAAKGGLSPIAIFWAAFFGCIVGDWISFKLGRKGKVLFGKGKIFGASYLEKGEDFFIKHGAKSIFLARFIGPLRPVSSFVAGLLKMKRKKFYLINTISISVWLAGYLIIGYFFGQAWRLIEVWSTRASLILFFIILFIAVIYWLEHILIKKGGEFLILLKSVYFSIKESLKNNEKIKELIIKHPVSYNFLKKRLDNKKFTGLPLTFLTIVFAYILFLFLGLVENIISQTVIYQIDINLSNLLFVFRDKVFVKIFYYITLFGKLEIALFAAILISIFFWLKGKREYLYAIWISFIGTEIFTYLTKQILARPRPGIEIYKERFFSFPSGHSALAVAFYGLVFYLFIREAKSWKSKINLFLSAFIFIILIGFSRLYLGAHYLSDVTGGFFLGGLWLILALSVLTWLKYKKETEARPIAQEKSFKIITIILIVIGILFFAFFAYFYKQPLAIPDKKEVSLIINENDILQSFSDNKIARYSETLLGNRMEPISFMVIAQDDDSLIKIFSQADWYLADNINFNSIIKITKAAIANTGYLAAPVTPSFWENEVNAFGFEKPTEKNTVRSRHHARFWKTDLITKEGKNIYIGTASKDEGLKWLITHKISPDIDTEREFIYNDLLKTGLIASARKQKMVDPELGQNQGGDLFFTDGQAYLIYLK